MFLHVPNTIDDTKYDMYKYDGLLFMSVVNHPLLFYDEMKKIDDLILPPSGFFVRSIQRHQTQKTTNKYELISFTYDKNQHIQETINKIKSTFPDILILGSKIAAIAYDNIYGLVKYKSDSNVYNIKYTIRRFFV